MKWLRKRWRKYKYKKEGVHRIINITIASDLRLSLGTKILKKCCFLIFAQSKEDISSFLYCNQLKTVNNDAAWESNIKARYNLPE